MGLPKHFPLLLPLIPMPPKLYSYIVARDFGFAPNPFYGFCTLATCKPQIRKRAEIGDWIVGTGSKSKGREGYLVYAMRVTEEMSFADYWADTRFHHKRPDMYGSMKKAFGDNIYHRGKNTGEWCQLDSHHSYAKGAQNHRNVQNDTKVDRVLISDDFIYFGGLGPQLPPFRGESICHSTQGDRCRFSEEVVEDFIAWVRSFNDQGYCGTPLEWE